jgi:hypothetical protein
LTALDDSSLQAIFGYASSAISFNEEKQGATGRVVALFALEGTGQRLDAFGHDREP